MTNRLPRSVGFWGLMFVSLGSIIGSGWLLGALNAATVAGPASVLSWMLAAAMLAVLALVYAELGATYPVAGGSARFSYYSHGKVAGFTAGWASWLQAVFIAPIEVLAAIKYINSVGWVHDHFNMMAGMGNDALLNSTGLVVALVLMGVFTIVNLAGAKFMSESNTLVVLWKAAIPLLTVAVIASVHFDAGNFHRGGGFMPFGWHGVFAALTGGVVFGLQGFEQAVQLAGEARDPKRDLSRAVVTAMAIGAVLYTLLQIVMIGALDPKNLVHGWSIPLGSGPSSYGAWYTLALALGATWLAKGLLVDAIISPAGTGVVYLGAAARLSYAMGEEREMPRVLTQTNAKGSPVTSILVSAVVGCVAFGPFKSWNALVNVVTSATAIMYGFAPISLAALHRLDGTRTRSYRMPVPKLLLPIAFFSANLIIYWGGFDTTWKLVVAMIVGALLFAIGAMRARTPLADAFRPALWMVPWLAGHVVLGALGGYGGNGTIPEWVDIGILAVFSYGVFALALRMTLNAADCADAVARDASQLETA
ncbi:MAG TPA: APC family permease [Kofleriaceae bacterium]|jgi:amino acid transporter|nr:APC family permease [Kofleriaceae bacterium]